MPFLVPLQARSIGDQGTQIWLLVGVNQAGEVSEICGECILVWSVGVVCDLQLPTVLCRTVEEVEVRGAVEAVMLGLGGRGIEIVVDVGEATPPRQSSIRLPTADTRGSPTYRVVMRLSPDPAGIFQRSIRSYYDYIKRSQAASPPRTANRQWQYTSWYPRRELRCIGCPGTARPKR